jgi:hypothetical protein
VFFWSKTALDEAKYKKDSGADGFQHFSFLNIFVLQFNVELAGRSVLFPWNLRPSWGTSAAVSPQASGCFHHHHQASALKLQPCCGQPSCGPTECFGRLTFMKAIACAEYEQNSSAQSMLECS